MRLALYLFISFTAGMVFQKWDAKHGSEWGQKAGRWTRTHIFGLPLINHDQTRRGRDD